MDAGRLEREVGLRSAGSPAGEVDERLVSQVVQTQPATARKRVLNGDDGDESLTRQRAAGDTPRRRGVGQPEYGDIHSAIAYGGDELVAPASPESDPHDRMRTVEPPEGRRDVDRGHSRDEPDGEGAPDFAVGCRGVGDGPLGRIEAGACRTQEGVPGGSQLHATVGAGEQRDTQLTFQSLDLMAECGLDDEAPVRRTSEAALLRDRDDVPHLLQLHMDMIYIHRHDDNSVLDSSWLRADDRRVMTTTTPSSPSTPTATGGNRLAWTAATAIVPAVWGTTYIVTTHLLPEGHPLFAAMMRSLSAGLIALLIARQPPRGSWWWKSLVLGTLNMAAFFPLLFLAAQHLPGGVAATLGAAQPIVVAFLAVGILHEKLSIWRVVWGVVGVAGVALMVLGPQAALDPIGIAAGLGGALSMGAGVVLTKKWGRPEDLSAIGLAGWQLTAAGLVLLLPALFIDGIPSGLDGPAVAGYAWLGLVGALFTYTLWFAAIRKLPVTATALLGLLSPLVAAILGAAVAGEALNAIQLSGFALTLAAMVAGQLDPKKNVLPTTKEGTP